MSIAKLQTEISSINATEAWLESMVHRGQRAPFAVIADLTPELAEILLSRNPENRPQKTWHIEEMADDIKAGRWVLNGQ